MTFLLPAKKGEEGKNRGERKELKGKKIKKKNVFQKSKNHF